MADKNSQRQRQRQSKINRGGLLIAVSLGACYMFFTNLLKEEVDDKKIVWATLFLSAFTLLTFGISWVLMAMYSPNPNNVTISAFFDSKLGLFKNILVGLSQGLIFGFIDNFGMYLGLDSLETLLKKNDRISNPIVIAGIGNLYSSIFGSIMGASLSKGIKQSTGISATPWWSDTLGILIGSVLGIYIPSLVMTKNLLLNLYLSYNK